MLSGEVDDCGLSDRVASGIIAGAVIATLLLIGAVVALVICFVAKSNRRGVVHSTIITTNGAVGPRGYVGPYQGGAARLTPARPHNAGHFMAPPPPYPQHINIQTNHGAVNHAMPPFAPPPSYTSAMAAPVQPSAPISYVKPADPAYPPEPAMYVPPRPDNSQQRF